MIAAEIAAAWGWRAEQIEPHAGGLINATYAVREGGEIVAALQRLHPIWAAEVNLDIEAVTAHVAARGMVTPRLLRTRDGRAWVEHDQRVWRALTWIAGETVHAVPDVAWAETGGELVGRFHRALADLAYDYRFTRAGVHDTAAHLGKLRALAATGGDGEPELVDLAREILAAADARPAMPELPRRHVHGDLKISNVIFRRAPLEARALVDLDTLAKGTLAFELGDAMRSWCNPHGEDAGAVHFELDIFAAAMRGFRAAADAVTSDAERAAIVVGLETVCLELAARFAADAFEDKYFGWDPARFPSRRAHNVVRARGQLALGLQVRARRAEASAVVLA
ncbi:MAG TPA: phosphotransferase [Kofleriaceae bacterium]|nr:phosphotransferase [Kofleriaceae bacterium]